MTLIPPCPGRFGGLHRFPVTLLGDRRTPPTGAGARRRAAVPFTRR